MTPIHLPNEEDCELAEWASWWLALFELPALKDTLIWLPGNEGREENRIWKAIY